MARRRILVVLAGATLALGLTGYALPHRSAEGAPDKNSGRRTIVLLDVNRVYKENSRFKAAMVRLQAEVNKAEAEVKRQKEKVRAERNEVEKLPGGSDERNKKEDLANRLEAAIAAQVQVQKKAFIREEAEIYQKTYHELTSQVEAYARANGIEVVLRTSRTTADVSKPDDVLREINQSIVWSVVDVDITSIIIERLNRRADASAEDSK
jgi:Skp family chaperone for outer membrane proteins